MFIIVHLLRHQTLNKSLELLISRGSLHTSQINYLLLYPSLWLLATLWIEWPLVPLQPSFNISSGQQYI